MSHLPPLLLGLSWVCPSLLIRVFCCDCSCAIMIPTRKLRIPTRNPIRNPIRNLRILNPRWHQMPLVMPIWPLASNALGNANLASPNHGRRNRAANKTKTQKQMSPDGHGPARYIHNKNKQVIAKSLRTAAINAKDHNTIDMTDAKTVSKTCKDALIGQQDRKIMSMCSDYKLVRESLAYS